MTKFSITGRGDKNPFVIQASVTKNQVPNPKLAAIEANNKTIERLQNQAQTWEEKRQSVEEDVRRECKEGVGLQPLPELADNTILRE